MRPIKPCPIRSLTVAFTALLLAMAPLSPAMAGAESATHSHAEKQAGPSGGRLVTSSEPHVEFWVNAERKVEIRFLDAQNRVVPPEEQVVNVIMGDRLAPTRLSFTRSGEKLVSDQPIPDGHEIPTILRIQAHPGAAAVMERFHLNLSACPGCRYAEYACTCDHSGGPEEGAAHAH